MNKTNNTKQTWTKPIVKAHELKLRTLLGENGWLKSGLNKPVLAAQIS